MHPHHGRHRLHILFSHLDLYRLPRHLLLHVRLCALRHLRHHRLSYAKTVVNSLTTTRATTVARDRSLALASLARIRMIVGAAPYFLLRLHFRHVLHRLHHLWFHRAFRHHLPHISYATLNATLTYANVTAPQVGRFAIATGQGFNSTGSTMAPRRVVFLLALHLLRLHQMSFAG
ncbi:hypothetical protein AB1Y20_022390 [Prymnesium parvum]|uniref:Uncharacterized protein n=1 Tax=Prymnesium parvum TaxID=97485 RepID=A0AB34JIP0_PRYPA